jgi:hypothetical protein
MKPTSDDPVAQGRGGELLIDCEEDRVLGAVLVGMLLEPNVRSSTEH